jgi:tetratricopeptide (TPR) repeat protein
MSEYPKKGLETALKKQRKALALDDKAPYIHNELGLIYMQMKDYKKAMALNDKHFIPFQQLGYLLTETTRYEEAEAMFRKAEELKNGALLDSDGDGVIDELDQEFNPTVGIQKTLYLLSNPKTVEDYMTNGLSYFINYNYKSAEQSFRKVMEMDPNHLEVYDYLGQITFIEKRYEEAELFFQKLIKLRPAEPMLRFKLADVYSAQNRWTESEKIYNETLQNNSISKEVKVEAYRKLINLFGKEHRYLDQERALWEITRQYKEKSDINQLENFYLAMLKVFPNNADWLYKQGAFYAEVKKDESKAVYGFEKLTSLDTNYSSRVYLHTRIGEYYQSTDPEKALSNLQKALDIKLDTVLGLYALLGKSAMLNQQPAAAIEAYQKEYALSDRSAELAYTIGRLYTGTGQKTEALEWLGCAFEAGFKNELVLKYDREWDAFRESTAWKTLRKE